MKAEAGQFCSRNFLTLNDGPLGSATGWPRSFSEHCSFRWDLLLDLLLLPETLDRAGASGGRLDRHGPVRRHRAGDRDRQLAPPVLSARIQAVNPGGPVSYRPCHLSINLPAYFARTVSGVEIYRHRSLSLKRPGCAIDPIYERLRSHPGVGCGAAGGTRRRGTHFEGGSP